ncbi:MAG: hypothetical protein K1X89_06415 [Myxococcaceae bacterium]|nr:hypothetical protein [Myxococcaceae bacterium]
MAFVLVAEASGPIAAALKKFLESGRHQVEVVHFLDAAVEGLKRRLPDVVLASASGNFDGEALCQRFKASAPGVPVVVMFPPDEERPEDRAARCGADSYLVGPLKRAQVLALVTAVNEIRTLRMETEPLRSLAEQYRDSADQARAELNAAQTELAQVRNAALGAQAELEVARGVQLKSDEALAKAKVQAARPPEATGDAEYLKRFMLQEVKRSRRYNHPVSVLVVGLDAGRGAGQAPEFRAQLKVATQATLVKTLRDVDLSMPMGEDRFLVLLPHTPREGAMVVAARLQEALAGVTQAPVSVGVSGFDPRSAAERNEVSFGGLMKDAGDALTRALAAGGGIEGSEQPKTKKRDRIAIG